MKKKVKGWEKRGAEIVCHIVSPEKEVKIDIKELKGKQKVRQEFILK